MSVFRAWGSIVKFRQTFFVPVVPEGSKNLNTRSLPKTLILIPNIETLSTLYLGTLDPWGFRSRLDDGNGMSPACASLPRPPKCPNIKALIPQKGSEGNSFAYFGGPGMSMMRGDMFGPEQAFAAIVWDLKQGSRCFCLTSQPALCWTGYGRKWTLVWHADLSTRSPRGSSISDGCLESASLPFQVMRSSTSGQIRGGQLPYCSLKAPISPAFLVGVMREPYPLPTY